MKKLEKSTDRIWNYSALNFGQGLASGKGESIPSTGNRIHEYPQVHKRMDRQGEWLFGVKNVQEIQLDGEAEARTWRS